MSNLTLRAYGYAPCKDCSKRSIGCHGVCPEYLRYLKENENIKAKKRAINDTGRASHWYEKG